MALFKCLQTGNTVEFDLEWDIAQMKSHPDYDEVIEEVKPVVEEVKPEIKKEPVKFNFLKK